MRQAKKPFEFTTAANVIRICGLKATTLAELLTQMRQCTDASIFHHTFQSLEIHHFLTEGFSNDFAQWALAACNEAALAERLAAVDLREYVSVAALRDDLVSITEDYIQSRPGSGDRPAFEPFWFCETVSVTVSAGVWARNLAEFVTGLESISLHAVHFHFLISRLRLQLRSNDFSHWLATTLDLTELAEQVNKIDIYTNTLEGVRQTIVKLCQPWVGI